MSTSPMMPTASASRSGMTVVQKLGERRTMSHWPSNASRIVVVTAAAVIAACLVLCPLGCKLPGVSWLSPEDGAAAGESRGKAYAVSPDGKRCVFVDPWTDPGPSRAYVVNLDTRLTRLVPTRGLTGSGTWSPDSTRFCGTRRRALTQSEQLRAKVPAAIGGQPTLAGLKRTSEVGILDAETLRWKPIRIRNSDGSWGTPTWSSDGDRIMFDVSVPGTRDTWRVYMYLVADGQRGEMAAGMVRGCGHCFWNEGFVFRRSAGHYYDPSVPGSEQKDLHRDSYFLQRRDGRWELLPGRYIKRMTVSPSGGHAAAVVVAAETIRDVSPWDDPPAMLYLVTIAGASGPPRARPLCSGRFRDIEFCASGDRIAAVLHPAQLAIINVETGEMQELRNNDGEYLCGWTMGWVENDAAIVYRKVQPDLSFHVWRYDVQSATSRRLYPFE